MLAGRLAFAAVELGFATSMKRTAIAIVALLALGACTTATPYQPLTTGTPVSGGFTDQQLDGTHFRVTFSGNDATPREQVETYLLYRAAELTANQGFDWFEMADRHTKDTGETFVDPYGPAWGYGYWRPSWRYGRGRGGWAFGGGWGYGGYWGGPLDDYAVSTIDKYSASAEVVMGHGPKPAAAFEAHEVMANLAPKIVRPK
ncbi:MAG TPA: hypothetical protein VGI95_12950 [Caulobacteraceae bacterium]|jgi:hypothetical protein